MNGLKSLINLNSFLARDLGLNLLSVLFQKRKASKRSQNIYLLDKKSYLKELRHLLKSYCYAIIRKESIYAFLHAFFEILFTVKKENIEIFVQRFMTKIFFATTIFLKISCICLENTIEYVRQLQFPIMP